MKIITAASVPRRLSGGIVNLRPVGIRDLGFVSRVLGDAAVLRASGLEGPLEFSRLSLFLWLRRTFRPAWVIECGPGPVGFLGLYNLCLGRSADIALVIADEHDRRRGYGTAAFRLVAGQLSSRRTVETFFVRVSQENRPAEAFWRSLGFRHDRESVGIMVMSYDPGDPGPA